MDLLDSLLTVQTLRGVLLVIGIWLFGKIIDQVLLRVFDRKLISPIVSGISWRIKGLLTRANPIETTLELTFSPREATTVADGKEIVENVIDEIGKLSKDRIEFGEPTWNSTQGTLKATHAEARYPYEIDFSLISDTEDQRERPNVSIDNRKISGIHVQVRFRYPFSKLKEELANVGSLASFLNRAFKETRSGTMSGAQFIIHPVDSNLTLDEWIRREEFDVSLLLASEGRAKTEVEFFPDRAEIHPPYLEIDEEVIRYIRLMIINYYLKG